MDLASLPLFEVTFRAGSVVDSYLENAISEGVAVRITSEALRLRFWAFKIISVRKIHNGL